VASAIQLSCPELAINTGLVAPQPSTETRRTACETPTSDC
jgi:hypothetical protein